MMLEGHILIVGGHAGAKTIAELIAAGASRHGQSTVIVECAGGRHDVEKLMQSQRCRQRSILIFVANEHTDFQKHRYDQDGIKISRLIKITKP